MKILMYVLEATVQGARGSRVLLESDSRHQDAIDVAERYGTLFSSAHGRPFRAMTC